LELEKFDLCEGLIITSFLINSFEDRFVLISLAISGFIDEKSIFYELFMRKDGKYPFDFRRDYWRGGI